MTYRYVYVIGVTKNPVKIGVARSLKARMATLQVGCPDDLKLHRAYRVPHEIAYEVERDTHAILQLRRRRGEWFDVDASEAMNAISLTINTRLAWLRDETKGKGWIAELRAEYQIDDLAETAWRRYQDKYRRETEPRSAYQKQADAFVVSRAGISGVSALRLVTDNDGDFKVALDHSPRLIIGTKKALASALNALSDFHAFEKEQQLLDSITA